MLRSNENFNALFNNGVGLPKGQSNRMMLTGGGLDTGSNIMGSVPKNKATQALTTFEDVVDDESSEVASKPKNESVARSSTPPDKKDKINFASDISIQEMDQINSLKSTAYYSPYDRQQKYVAKPVGLGDILSGSNKHSRFVTVMNRIQKEDNQFKQTDGQVRLLSFGMALQQIGYGRDRIVEMLTESLKSKSPHSTAFQTLKKHQTQRRAGNKKLEEEIEARTGISQKKKKQTDKPPSTPAQKKKQVSDLVVGLSSPLQIVEHTPLRKRK